MTTLVRAELLGALDPAFDADASARALASFQSRDGLFRAVGPEALC